MTAVGQREVMRAIFPRVKCCEFVGTVPYITQAKEHESAFQGFLVEEELRSLLRFADKPGKVSLPCLLTADVEYLTRLL